MENRYQRFIMFMAAIIATSHSLNSVMPPSALKKEDKAGTELQCQRSEQLIHTINVVVGQKFNINLDSQPSTGYTWYIVEPILEDQIQLLGKTVMPYRCPGGRGKTIFTFQAIKEGRETIVCEYARPWSWNIAQRQTYIVNIQQKNLTPFHAKHILPPFMQNH